jgi:hypothetical protein
MTAFEMRTGIIHYMYGSYYDCSNTMGENNATRIGGVIVSVYASSVVDHGFAPRSGQTNDYKMCTSPLSTQH